MAHVKVPAALTGGSTENVAVSGDTVGEIFDHHAAEHGPTLKESVIAGDEIKEFINVFVDGEQVESLDEPVADDSEIRIMPAASGGSALHSSVAR